MGKTTTQCYARATMDLNETTVFVAVARAGSFTRASERLGVAKGTLSRQVARLERRLGARLLQRTTRRVAMTDIGRAYYERCLPAVEAIEDAERLVADVSGAVTGTLRISVAFDVGRDWLAQWLPELRRRYPELRLEVEVTQRRVDLVADGIDVAVRGGAAMEDAGYVARKLAPSTLVLCASPEYLKKHGTPRRIEDLAEHDCLTAHGRGGSTRWRFAGPDGPIDVELRGWLVVTEFGVLREAARAGLGIGLIEVSAVRSDFEQRRLIRVLPGYEIAGGGLWAVYPSAQHLSAKVRTFVDFLVERAQEIHPSAGRHGAPKRPDTGSNSPPNAARVVKR